MPYFGDLLEDEILYFEFNTRDTDFAPITLAGTPSLAVYKDDGTTQSTAGLTLSVDHDSVTGKHMVKVDTSADAFYATGADYSVVIAAGTVDSISVVGSVVGTFSIENRNIKANVTQLLGTAWLTPGTAGTPDVNVKLISADSTAADTLELFAEALDQTTGQIDSGSFAAGAIDASAIAANAIGSSEIADGAITAAKIATGAIDADALAADFTDEIWDEVMTGTTTGRQTQMLSQAVLAGKASGMDTGSPIFRNIADTTDVVAATTDSDGNRTAVTITYP